MLSSFSHPKFSPYIGIIKFRCFEVKKEDNKRPAIAGDQTQDTWLVHAASVLSLSYDNRTNTSPHNSYCIYSTTRACRGL